MQECQRQGSAALCTNHASRAGARELAGGAIVEENIEDAEALNGTRHANGKWARLRNGRVKRWWPFSSSTIAIATQVGRAGGIPDLQGSWRRTSDSERCDINHDREALLNGRPTIPSPDSIREAKIVNKLNINECQTLIEVKAEINNVLKSIFPTVENPTLKIKTEINKWLATFVEDSPPPPPKSTVRSVTQYHNNKILIETTSKESSAWLKQNGSPFLNTLFGHPVLVLGRLYLVIARFMPVLFHTNEESTQELEISTNLPANSISQV